MTLTNETVISIRIEPDDLLPLQCVSLLRAGDYNIQPEHLEIDTYHKLSNAHYQCVLDNLVAAYFDEQDVLAAYRAIADPSWPKIKCIADYYTLPGHIRQECEQQHGLRILTLDQDHPHCPRDILIEFFQIGFLNPAEHGFIKAQESQIHTDCKIYEFPFGCFYQEDKFMKEMAHLSDFLQMPSMADHKDFVDLHREFLVRQCYKDIKKNCDNLVDLLVQNPAVDLPVLDVIQEAYVRAMLIQRKTQ